MNHGMRRFFVALIRSMFPDVTVIHINLVSDFGLYDAMFQSVSPQRKFALIRTFDFFRNFSELPHFVSYISLMVSQRWDVEFLDLMGSLDCEQSLGIVLYGSAGNDGYRRRPHRQ